MNKPLDPGDLLLELGTIDTLEQALVLYKQVGMRAASMALKTREEYGRDLADLVAFLARGGITGPAQVTLAHLRVYLAELERQGYQASTRNRKVYAIKGFFGCLQDYAIVCEDVARHLIPPPVERGEPRFLTEAEYTRLLQAASGNLRDTAILELFLQTGLRLSELVNLSIRDVTLATPTGSVCVKCRGGHAVIPLNHKAQNALKKWLEVRDLLSDTALFLTAVNKPMGKRGVQLMVAKYLDEANIEDASVQSLKHTMAVHHLARGTELKTLASILGDRVETLEAYRSAARKVRHWVLQENML